MWLSFPPPPCLYVCLFVRWGLYMVLYLSKVHDPLHCVKLMFPWCSCLSLVHETLICNKNWILILIKIDVIQMLKTLKWVLSAESRKKQVKLALLLMNYWRGYCMQCYAILTALCFLYVISLWCSIWGYCEKVPTCLGLNISNDSE